MRGKTSIYHFMTLIISFVYYFTTFVNYRERVINIYVIKSYFLLSFVYYFTSYG
nr:MAG TPA: hypothetical protein [Caudoviricetes sp.]